MVHTHYRQLRANLSLSLLFDPQNGGNVFFRNAGGFLNTQLYNQENSIRHSHHCKDINPTDLTKFDLCFVRYWG
jgi:hypothetical protein